MPTPIISKRAAMYADVPDEKWNDWRWQLSHRLNTAEDIEKVLPLTDSERKALQTQGLFRVDVTPYFISLVDPDDPNDPVRKQIIPLAEELNAFTSMMEDSLAEDRHSPVPGLVHRYPDRVLMLVTTQCASYCRYCTRSRIVGDPGQTFSRQEFEAQIEYLKRTPQVRDVLLSGGDPLVLAPKILEEILTRLREIPHIEIVRIGSRVPVFMPMRVTQELCDMLAKFHPLWLNIHVNHPNEISKELAEACDRMTRAGIPLGNQSVLLAGINDCVHLQRELVQKLTRIRVRPYYLYQCDLVEGAGHFRTPVAKGIEIIEALRGHTSGYAVPQFIVDAPGGGGKIPVMPNYMLSMSDHKIIVRNYEGYVTSYEEPAEYKMHDPKTCKFCQNKRPEPGQSGLTGLLDGDQMFIKPEGFDELHNRGGIQHRLKDESKWKPLGIGSGESTDEFDTYRTRTKKLRHKERKMQKTVIILAAFMLVLTACAPGASAAGNTQSDIETAVALTVGAQNQIGTSVALTVAAQNPTGTATPTVSPTGLIPPSLTPVIPTITPIAITPPTASGGGVRPKPQFACDVIHQRPFDNTEFNPGADFDIKWTILNTGTKSWYQGFDVKYLSGPNMITTGLTRIQLPAMDPGDQYDIVFDAKAPMEKGFHVMTWVVDGPTCYPYVAIIVK